MPAASPSRPAAWRLPLQTGEGALYALGAAALLWLPALALAFVTLVVVWSVDLGDLTGWLMAPGALLGFFCWKQLRRAWALRPSDLELTADALVVQGGPLDGRRYAFEAVRDVYVKQGSPQGLSVIDHAEGDDDTELHALWLVEEKSRGTPLAKSGAAAEIASLEDVAATLAEAVRPRPAPKKELPPKVLRCEHCHGPVAPSGEATTPCSWCGKPATVPEATREKVKADEVLSRHPAKAVAQVLAQTPAHVVDAQYRVVALMVLLAWPVAVSVAAVNAARQQSTWGSVGLLGLFILGTVFGALAVFRTRLVERQALRLLTLRFTALAPEGEGKPRRCRSCEGPLPSAGQGALVTCAWCDAPNVLGVDRRLHARAALGEARSLEALLRRRDVERRVWGGLGLLGVVLLAGSVWALLAALGQA